MTDEPITNHQVDENNHGPKMRDPQPWVDRLRLHRQPFAHCSAGLYIGCMKPEPKAGEFASVLTLAVDPGTVDESIRHRHIPLSYQFMNREHLTLAVDWTLAQFDADRTVLVRSEGGRQRPGLVVAATFLRLGGTYIDATGCVSRGDPYALTDFRYLNILRDLDQR